MYSSKLLSGLAQFYLSEIGVKALDGITYALKYKDNKSLDEYFNLCKLAQKEEDKPGSIFRVYEVSNGYIFDMNMDMAKQISYGIAKSVAKTNGTEFKTYDFIGDRPEKRRNSDIIGLGKNVISSYKEGKEAIEVALFNRNSLNKIRVTGRNELSKDKEMITVIYDAYAIRHWDIEKLNAELLIPAGIRISKVEPFGIIPRCSGVKFILYISEIG